MPTTVHAFRARTIDGEERALSDYAGKVLLVVNVASKCGLTPQYEGLQALYEKYAERGLEILGFPCNQFMGQEPGTEAEIKHFCQVKYDVTFPLFAKIDVNGPGAHPLYVHLKAQPTSPDGPGEIGWNFAKFLVDREGRVIARFAPTEKPQSAAIVGAIEKALG
ncbi:MAG: glutathione peroxidase [Sandaracinaceae bacterium]